MGRGACRDARIQINNSFIKATLCILAAETPSVKPVEACQLASN